MPPKLKGEALVFWIVTLPPTEVMTGGVAGLRQLDALTADGADGRRAMLQRDDGLAALRQNVEGGTAHADRRQPGA